MVTYNEFIASRQDMTVDGYNHDYGDQIEDGNNVERVLTYGNGYFIIEATDYGYVLDIYNYSFSGTLPDMEQKLWDLVKNEFDGIDVKVFNDYDRVVAIHNLSDGIGINFHQGAKDVLMDYINMPDKHLTEIWERLSIRRGFEKDYVDYKTVNDAIELYIAAFVMQEETLDKLFN